MSDDTFEKIEKALDITLYDWQKAYLNGDKSVIPDGRRNGKTLSYCVKLALSEGEPIRSCDLINWADGYHGDNYSFRWFPRYFLEIWYSLKDAGLPVRILTRNDIKIT